MTGSRSLLLFEPDPAVRAALSFALELEGFSLRGAGDGQDDLAGIDCLVIEQRLPGRDGLSLLAELRGRGCSAPAILLSTNPTRRLRADALAADALLIEKPLLGDSLTEALHALFDTAKAV